MDLHLLKPGEDLETFAAKVAEANGRPCYLASGQFQHGTHYRKPGRLSFKPLVAAELFFSLWWDKGRCVRREAREGKRDAYYYELELAPRSSCTCPTSGQR